MPVTGTPVSTPPVGALVCADQDVAQPKIAAVDGRQVLARMRAVETNAGQASTVRWTMVNRDGDPVDLTTCIPPGSVKLRIREAIQATSDNPVTEIDASVVTASAGIVEAVLTAAVVAYPGISIGEFGVVNESGGLIFSNLFYLVVNRGNWAAEYRDAGPLSIPEIRLHLRDSGPEDNLWLDVEEFDLAELAACIERPVRYWNEAPPPIDHVFNTANFPFRFHWLEGTIACLYQMAAAHYRRVHLPYSAGGVTVDDKNKSQEYEAIGARRWEVYRDWVQKKKVQLNCEAAIQSTGSPYSGVPWAW